MDARSEVTAQDDAQLVARARSGDRAAFGELVDRHARAARRVAAVISNSTQEADDIVQDAMVKAYRSVGTYRGTGSPRSWLLRIVANEAKNHVRSRVRRRRRDDRQASLELRVDDAPDDRVLERFEHERLAVALAGLGAADRAVLGCRFVAGLSERDTAEVLGVAPGTVKSRTSRALERLRTRLEETT